MFIPDSRVGYLSVDCRLPIYSILRLWIEAQLRPTLLIWVESFNSDLLKEDNCQLPIKSSPKEQ